MAAVQDTARTSWSWLPDETGVGRAVVGDSQSAFEFLQSLAVTRVGPDNVRSAALPYVMEKILSAQAHE